MGGTRSFEKPQGEPATGLSPGEQQGNELAAFAAKPLEKARDSNKFLFAENPVPSGCYPAMCDLPQWKKLL